MKRAILPILIALVAFAPAHARDRPEVKGSTQDNGEPARPDAFQRWDMADMDRQAGARREKWRAEERRKAEAKRAKQRKRSTPADHKP